MSRFTLFFEHPTLLTSRKADQSLVVVGSRIIVNVLGLNVRKPAFIFANPEEEAYFTKRAAEIETEYQKALELAEVRRRAEEARVVVVDSDEDEVEDFEAKAVSSLHPLKKIRPRTSKKISKLTLPFFLVLFSSLSPPPRRRARSPDRVLLPPLANPTRRPTCRERTRKSFRSRSTSL